MALWMVRSGKYGEREQFNLERSIVSIGWEEIPDLRPLSERSALTTIMSQQYPDKKPSAIANWVGQVWTFAKTIREGDLVAMPLKSTSAVQFGTVTSDYQYSNDFMKGAEHYRKVEWIKAVPRTAIDPDLLYSLGAIMTVCRIERNDAESRIRTLLATPGTSTPRFERSEDPAQEPSDARAETINLDEVLRDAIRSHIARKFSGHELAGLVEAVLRAQGYKTFLSPPGPDGGVDVLAGLGPHGFDGTKLAVQVKSGDIKVDTMMLRLFKNAMQEHGADRGLIVSWGGFQQNVKKEIAHHFFHIRMWGEPELLDEILSTYDLLPATIQARLPLKRTWMLVVGDD